MCGPVFFILLTWNFPYEVCKKKDKVLLFLQTFFKKLDQSDSEMSWKGAQSSGQASGSDIRVLVQEMLERPKKLRKLIKMGFSKILINLISMSEKFESLKFLWHVAF